MNWKENLTELEDNENWKEAIEVIQHVIIEYPNNVEAYIRGIYLLHHILVEEDYPKAQHDFLADLLKSFFKISYHKFYGNAEYLFFIGKILYIAEWYFGVDDDFKPIEERLAFQMQKKAHDLEIDNKLFKWAYLFSLGDNMSKVLAKQILADNNIMTWLDARGLPGKYIKDSLKQNSF